MIPESATLVYELNMPIRWVDMDAYGHVNASIYFTYFEQTRISWMLEAAPPNFKLGTVGPVVVNESCSFLKSIIYPETIVIKLFNTPPGRSSFETFYQIVSQKNPSIIYAEGSAKIVWVDRKKEKSVPIPDEIRKLLPKSKP